MRVYVYTGKFKLTNTCYFFCVMFSIIGTYLCSFNVGKENELG